jgi:hypothetical protein
MRGSATAMMQLHWAVSPSTGDQNLAVFEQGGSVPVLGRKHSSSRSKGSRGPWHFASICGPLRLSNRKLLVTFHFSYCGRCRPKKAPLSVHNLFRWEIYQDHVGAFFKASENYVFSIRRDIKVVDEKLSVEVG